MTARLNIHIGYPRTGTTSLQATLTEYRDHLGENNILVPPSIGNRHRHLQALGEVEANPNVSRILGIHDTVSVDDFLDNWLEGVAAASKQFSLTVMSEETIALRGTDSLARLKAKLDKHYSEIKIFVCFRPHESYLKSNHQQSIRATFRNNTFKNYINTTSSKPHMHYVKVMKSLVDVFGNDKVRAFVYAASEDESSNRQILTAMSDSVLHDATIPGEMNQTRNIHPDALDFKRLTNGPMKRALAELNYVPSGDTHALLLEAIGQVFETCKKAPPPEAPSEVEQIDARFLRRWARDWSDLTGKKFKSNFGK